MPLEVILLTPRMLSIEDQREFAELLNPPAVARESPGGGTLSFTELDDTPVLTLGRPRRVTAQTDLRRLLGDALVPDDTAFITEGVVPFADHKRGLTLLYSFAEATGGTAHVRGLSS